MIMNQCAFESFCTNFLNSSFLVVNYKVDKKLGHCSELLKRVLELPNCKSETFLYNYKYSFSLDTHRTGHLQSNKCQYNR